MPKEISNLFKKNPEYFNKTSYISIYINGSFVDSYKMTKHIPSNDKGITVKKDSLIFKEYKKIGSMRKEFYKQREKIREVLNSVNTDKKLIEYAPEFKKYLKKCIPESTVALPIAVGTLNNVRQIIK